MRIRVSYRFCTALWGLFLFGFLFLVPLSCAAAQQKVIGGVSAQSSTWPWMAALIDAGGDTYTDQFCGAVLIHPRWVMTAAHCLHSYSGNPVRPGDVAAVLGLTNLKQDIGEQIDVERIIIHPDYEYDQSDDADIALLKLKTASSRKPIRLFTGRSDLAGIYGTVIGWGVKSFQNFAPAQLQQASVPIVSNNVCNAAYTRTDLYPEPPVTEGMMCAGFLEGGRDTCLGDSGGPLMIRDGSEWKVAGITSWGEGCAEPGYFGVYTRVSAYLDFIETYVPLPSAPVHLYFPFAVSDGVQETEIVVINTGPDAVEGKFSFFDSSGEELVSDNMAVFISPYGRNAFRLGEEFFNASDIRYVLFETDADHVTGYERVFTPGKQAMSLPAVSEINAGDLYLPLTVTEPGWETGVHLVNTTSEAKELLFHFETGESISKILNPYAADTFSISALFEGNPPAGLSSAIIKNSAGVIGLHTLEVTGAGDRRQLSGFLLSDHLLSDFSCFHIGNDPNWWTGMVLFNPWDEPAEVTLTPFSDSGRELTPFTVQIEGNRKFVAVSGDPHLPPDAAWFQASSPQPVSGFDAFGSSDGNLMEGYHSIPNSRRDGVFPRIGQDGWTALVMLNTENRNNDVTMKAYDENGVLQAVEVLLLSPHQRYLAMADAIFGDGLKRATHIRFTSDGDLSAFQVSGSADGTMMDALPALEITAWKEIPVADDPDTEPDPPASPGFPFPLPFSTLIP